MVARTEMRRLHKLRRRLGRIEFLRIHKRKNDAARKIQKMRNAWALGNYCVKRKRHKTHLAITAQRIGWGRLARREAAKRRFKKHTKAAIVIQGLLRGRLGRKRWVQTHLDVNATKIQSVMRRYLAIGAVDLKRTNRYFVIQRANIKMRCFWRKVQTRSKAARKCQACYRMFHARRTFKRLYRIDRTIRIQRWFRRIMIYQCLQKTARVAIYTYRFYNKLMYPRLGVYRFYHGQRLEAFELCRTTLHEANRVCHQSHWFINEWAVPEDPFVEECLMHKFGWRKGGRDVGRGSWIVPERWRMEAERLRLVKYLIDIKTFLRTLYLKISIQVIKPDDLFKFKIKQLENFVRDMGLHKSIDKADLDGIFYDATIYVEGAVIEKAEEKKEEKAPWYKAKVVDKEPKTPKSFGSAGGTTLSDGPPWGPEGRPKIANHELAKLSLDLAGFIDVCLGLTNLVIPVVDPKDPDGRQRSITTRFQLFKETYLEPLTKDFKLGVYSLAFEGDDTIDIPACKKMPAVAKVLDDWRNRIKKLFDRCAGANQGDGDDSLDVLEYCLMLNNQRCIDANLSNSICLEVFVRCNYQEVDEYLSSEGDADFTRIYDLAAEWEEFVDCLIVCAHFAIPKKGRKDTFDYRLKTFCERLLGLQ